ncbi:aromatic ring-hydroxylating dioxygenase subunit alpha [Mycolicibacterium sp. SCSIO 43805]|uniref:aromatic ring-hydroxylating dioxygenase subunit alpha n=1 Tax=Mycolicibacterium sp. SCSIO 43805 TaxID=3378074 RepID=UPI003AB62B4C
MSAHVLGAQIDRKVRPVDSMAPDATTMRTLENARGSILKGRLPASLIANAALYELELKRVFGRTWQFLCHEDEIPNAGDYVVRYIADNSIIVARQDMTIRAMSNSCRHRGTLLCRTESGNESAFQCPYHGWTYRNNGDLIAIPAQQAVYGAAFDKSRLGLRALPMLDSYAGLVFGCVSDEAPGLDEYLGDMRWYLDLMMKKSPAGLEAWGAPQRWVIDANWKTGADNFVGDGYHTVMTHRSMCELGLLPPDNVAVSPAHVSLSGGHGAGVLGAPPGIPAPPYMGYPEEVVSGLSEGYGDDVHGEMLKRTMFIHGNVFPNLSFLNAFIAKDGESMPVPILTLRQWRPLDAARMEVWSWFFVERNAPEEFKQQSFETYVRTFGVGGVFEQDDAEIFQAITKGTRGELAGGVELNLEMGLDNLAPDPTWLGPGRPLASGYAEQNQREYWKQYFDYLATPRRDENV